MSYTKGKWEVKCYSTATSYLVSYVVESSRKWIACGIRVEADARLIAAAPDMHEALKATQKLLQGQYEILLGTYPEYGKYPEIDMVDKALAKVEGK